MRWMLPHLPAVLILLVVFIPGVQADPSLLNDGVLIAHAPAGMEFSSSPPPGGWCEVYRDQFAIDRWEDQRVTVPGGPGSQGVIWFVLAAWEEEKQMSAVAFGLADYDAALFGIADWGLCHPASAIELPTEHWPGPNEGTAIAGAPESWYGNFLPVYYFAGYAYGDVRVPLGTNPPTGFAGFASSGATPESFGATCLGTLGIGCEGSACYPDPALEPRACCVDGGCELLSEADCENAGGIRLFETSCDPSPCPPVAACCIGEQCRLETPETCFELGGEWFLGASTCLPNPCTAQLYTVSPDGHGDFPTIQAAVDAALPGVVIELSDGVFTGEGNRDLDLRGKAITLRAASGDPNRCVLSCEGSPTQRHRGLYLHRGEGGDTVIEGIGFRGGCELFGGAISCDNGASPTIRSCAFSDNVGLSSGGAIACDELSSPTISLCRFEDNRGQVRGGAIACEFGSWPRIEDCDFKRNRAAQSGGAVCAAWGAVPLIAASRFADNRAGNGGAVGCLTESNLVLTDCDFERNIAETFGGGVLITGGTPTFDRVRFVENRALTSRGGGLCVTGGFLQLKSVTFTGNQALESYGGGLACNSLAAVSGTNLLFAGNHAAAGGGMGCDIWNNTVTLNSSVWLNNVADTGGGIYSRAATILSLTQSTLMNNTADIGAGIYAGGRTAGELENVLIVFSRRGEAVACGEMTDAPILSCCDLYGNEGGDWTGCIAEQSGQDGNIAADPLVCEPASFPRAYGIHADSPCAPAQHPLCGQIGAWYVACGETPAEGETADVRAPQDAPLGSPALGPCRPNPFQETTRIALRVSAEGPPPELTVHDVTGREVRRLTGGPLAAGDHQIPWDGRTEDGARCPAGIYYIRLRAGEEVIARPVLITR